MSNIIAQISLHKYSSKSCQNRAGASSYWFFNNDLDVICPVIYVTPDT